MSFHAPRWYGLSRRDVIKTAVGAAASASSFFDVTPAAAAI
jgi:multiple sugar transport system substrate-binding protein